MFAIITAMRRLAKEAGLLYYSFLRLSDFRMGVAYCKNLSLFPFVPLLKVVLKMKLSMQHCWAMTGKNRNNWRNPPSQGHCIHHKSHTV
jgi:hypothetical protein